ncbi:MAG: DUF4062 domain-containing protein [Planctomycetota bacterium]|nr:DUF4062 domain-containing protein [Planctomycetota bacterium]
MTSPSRIFISSVQKEFSAERRALKAYLAGDALLRRFFDVFLFEDLPASGRRADEIYLAEVDRCDVYLALLGNEYGHEDRAGVSPTEHEFDRATAKGKERLVFVCGAGDPTRHPKMQALIGKASAQLTRRRFDSTPELTALVYASLVEHLERSGQLRTKPFDAAACPDATLADLSREKVSEFLAAAKAERGYAVGPRTSTPKALAHLNLLDGDQPSHAAVLLFGKKPQRFLITSEVKCLHFHGTEVQKPIPSYHIYKGTVFELVDQAVDFVMAKLNRAVIPRNDRVAGDVEYELPFKAVREAIVNAVTHRDYTSNASVQVMLFADRLEIWNPGELPPTLTIAGLRLPHASIPHNPLIAEPMFLATYAEKAGSGILDMIKLCRAAGVRTPEFRQDGGQFVQTIWRPKTTASPQDNQPSRTSQSDEAHNQAHDQAHDPLTEQVTEQVTEHVVRLLRALAKKSAGTKQIMQSLRLRHRPTLYYDYLQPSLNTGLVEMTQPSSPKSPTQKYRLTAKGRAALLRLS